MSQVQLSSDSELAEQMFLLRLRGSHKPRLMTGLATRDSLGKPCKGRVL